MRVAKLIERRYQQRLKKFATAAFLAIGLVAAGVAYSAPTQCPGHYFNDERPDLINPKLELSAKELCSDGYAVWYSGVARAPLWSAEFLSPGRVQAARGLPRSNNFREDTRLPGDWRAKLSDFRGSGFDRGHMAPSGDMPNPAADSQSFLLSNIIAQDPHLNRNLWAAIEMATRAKAAHGPLYVITGPLFLGPSIARLNKRVMIPTHVFKLLYDPRTNSAAAYFVPNASHKRHQEITLEQLEELAGISFLPGAEHVTPMKLPRPRYPR